MNALYCWKKYVSDIPSAHGTAIAGSFLTFSSPIVNLPWVCSLFSANFCRFRTASFCSTVTRNLTFCFVYSCPGYAPTTYVSPSHSPNCTDFPFQSLRPNSHRLSYHPVRQPRSRSAPYAFLPGYLRRTDRILHPAFSVGNHRSFFTQQVGVYHLQ